MTQIQDNISETKQRLSYNDIVLEDGLSLLDYGITKDTTINLSIIIGFTPEVFLTFDKNPKIEFAVKVRLQDTHTVKDMKLELLKLYPFEYENLVFAAKDN